VAVQQGGDPVGVGEDPGDVGGGREAADQRPPGVADQLGLQPGEVDVAVAVLADGHHLGGRLAPGQEVGVVLERPHEHHRPRPGRRRAQAQEADQLGHGRGRSRPGEDDQILAGAADGPVDRLAACSRSRVVWRPVPELSVWALA
jgi:hypothetical protein